MPAITFDDFSGGMDQRSRRNVGKGKAFWLLNNCHPTTGLKLRKRPAWSLQAEPTVSGEFPVGLTTDGVKLYSFSRTGQTVTWPALPGYTGDASTVTMENLYLDGHAAEIIRVYFAQLFSGFWFVIAEDSGGTIELHYVAGGTTNITDVNRPTQGKNAVIAKQKVWVPDGDKVRYCATGDPTDWTLSGDAGFIPVAQNSPGSDVCKSVGLYQGDLVVFMLDNIQIYNIDPDPANIALQRVIDGVGSAYPGGNAPVSADLFFATEGGVRSLSTLELTDNVADIDVGSPVAEPMGQDIGALETDVPDDAGAVAYWFQGLGQYWVASQDYVWTYTFSRTSKLSAWARYSLEDLGSPFMGWELAERRGTVFRNDRTAVYMFDRTRFRDELLVSAGPVQFGASGYGLYDNSDGLASVVDSPRGTLSFWFRRSSISSSEYLFAGERFEAIMINTGAIWFNGRTTAGPNLVQVKSNAGFDDDAVHHCLIAFDTSANQAEIYIDGVSVISSGAAPGAGSVGFTTDGPVAVAGSGVGGLLFQGEIAELWFLDDVALFPSTAANLTAFYDSTNHRTRDFGDSGTVTISGTPYTPRVYLTGGASEFLTNKGNDGHDFTLQTGTIADGISLVRYLGNSPPPITAEQAFDPYKKPGQMKQAIGFDLVASGTTTIEILINPDNLEDVTGAVQVSGDTRADGMVGIDFMATEAAVRFTHARDEAWELDLFTVYYDVLGTM